MNHTDSAQGNSSRRGILLMIASMAMFSIADALVKISTTTLSSAQVLFYLIGGALGLFILMAIMQGEKLLDRRVFSPILLLRYLAEILGMVGMVKALSLVPISTVGAVTQATPILAALGAVFFLREQIGWRRWSCIGVGFVGVLLIVQPGASGFNAAVLWAVLALAALSARDLTTRLIPTDMASVSLATYTMAAAAPVALVWVLMRGESPFPAGTNWLIIAPMIVTGAIGYMLLIASIRTADVSVVMPFRFMRVVFLLGIGVFIFGEKPDWLMLAGAVLIVSAGAYMMQRERAVNKALNSGSKNTQ